MTESTATKATSATREALSNLPDGQQVIFIGPVVYASELTILNAASRLRDAGVDPMGFPTKSALVEAANNLPPPGLQGLGNAEQPFGHFQVTEAQMAQIWAILQGLMTEAQMDQIRAILQGPTD